MPRNDLGLHNCGPFDTICPGGDNKCASVQKCIVLAMLFSRLARIQMQNLKKLIPYLLSEVADLGGYTTTLRLHKFLYLIDLEHWRRYGRTLTGLAWQFHHYGPYAPVLARVGRELGLDVETEEFSTADAHTGTLFSAPYYSGNLEGLSFAQKAMIDGLLRIWADQETEVMLEYVYNSEPIKYGQRYQPLDWSLAKRGSRYVELYVQIEPEIAARLRESLRSCDITDERVEPIETLPMDQEMYLALEALEDSAPIPDMSDVELDISPEELLRLFPPEQD